MKLAPWAIGAVMGVASMLSVPMAFALPGDDPSCPEKPGKTCTQTPPVSLLCPQGYAPAPAPQQPAVGTLCVTVGQDRAGNLHAVARVSPVLCAHVAVGDNAKPEDIVRTLHCPVYVPPAAPPAEVPAPAKDLPVAQAPTTVVSDLPVTG